MFLFKMKNNYIIGISGASGVGKTTLANLISLLFNRDEVLILSGDDLHKWERHSTNWNTYTHFHPEANNLSLGFSDLQNLKSGNSIKRKTYNHDTGFFDEYQHFSPKPYIIYEGLHSLYGEDILNLIDLKIFIDTDNELTNEWKIKRDILKRGYTTQQVQETIIRRQEDRLKYILPQKNNSDVVFTFKKYHNKVVLDYILINEHHEDIVKKIKHLHDSLVPSLGDVTII